MRDSYTVQLDELAAFLTGMCADAAAALEQATTALLRADLPLAQQVMNNDRAIDDKRQRAEDMAFQLLVLQAPVATDLRLVISAIHAAADIQRMAALAKHVAEAAIRRHPHCALPDQIAGYFAEMGLIGVELARQAIEIIKSRDLEAAKHLEVADDAMDDLHQHMFRELMDKSWAHGVEAAVDAVLLARFYERYADHAVAIGRRIIYIVTGQMPGPLAI